METKWFPSQRTRALAAACVLAASATSWAFTVGQAWPQPLSFLFAYAAVGGPFVAAGVWFGKTWLGLIVGLVALFGFIHFLLPLWH